MSEVNEKSVNRMQVVRQTEHNVMPLNPSRYAYHNRTAVVQLVMVSIRKYINGLESYNYLQEFVNSIQPLQLIQLSRLSQLGFDHATE